MRIKLPHRMKISSVDLVKKRIYEVDDVKLVLSLSDLYRIRNELILLLHEDEFNHPTLEYLPLNGHYFNKRYSKIKYRVKMINYNCLDLNIIHLEKHFGKEVKLKSYQS